MNMNKKEYKKPTMIVAQLEAFGYYMDEDDGIHMGLSEEWLDTNAKKFDEWGDEIVTEGEDDEFYSW